MQDVSSWFELQSPVFQAKSAVSDCPLHQQSTAMELSTGGSSAVVGCVVGNLAVQERSQPLNTEVIDDHGS